MPDRSSFVRIVSGFVCVQSMAVLMKWSQTCTCAKGATGMVKAILLRLYCCLKRMYFVTDSGSDSDELDVTAETGAKFVILACVCAVCVCV